MDTTDSQVGGERNFRGYVLAGEPSVKRNAYERRFVQTRNERSKKHVNLISGVGIEMIVRRTGNSNKTYTHALRKRADLRTLRANLVHGE